MQFVQKARGGSIKSLRDLRLRRRRAELRSAMEPPHTPIQLIKKDTLKGVLDFLKVEKFAD